jgi:hypothetical protein
MHRKLSENPGRTKRLSKIRSKTVEPVLGTLLNFLGMKRVNTRGIGNANKHVLMAALTYNVKKLLKFDRKRVFLPAKANKKDTMQAEFQFFIFNWSRDVCFE